MILTDVTKFDAYRFTLLVAKINNIKSEFDLELADTETYLKGYRYNDNQRIARMVIGDIYAECEFNLEKANQKFLSLNSEETVPYIKKSILDSASADHWYTYEKQW